MVVTTRRALLEGLLSAGGAFTLSSPLRAMAIAALIVPEGTMRLGRVLVRELGDGAAITVDRSWNLSFVRQARGIVISGRQVRASVDAPPSLSELARIEQQRDTQAMFPIMLSETGLVVGSGSARADLGPALRAAEKMIAARPQSETQRGNLRRYLAEIHRAGTGQFDSLPPDLFVPTGTPQRVVETLSLPGGLAGTFELLWEARAALGIGWLIEGQRQIITRIEGVERRSSEEWTLGPV